MLPPARATRAVAILLAAAPVLARASDPDAAEAQLGTYSRRVRSLARETRHLMEATTSDADCSNGLEALVGDGACVTYVASIETKYGAGIGCTNFFCETCEYAGYCDVYCGFCDDDDGATAIDTSDVSAPAPAPAPAPTDSADISGAESSSDCYDGLAEELGIDTACSDFVAKIDAQYGDGLSCANIFCSTCQYANLCDNFCGYCSR